MALAVIVLITAGLLIRSFIRVIQLDLGFKSDRVLSGIVSLPQSRYKDRSKQANFFEEALRRIQTIPGVQSAAVSDSIPLTGINDQGGFIIEGRPPLAPGQDGPQANRPRVSAGYFETMGITLIMGRLLDPHDGADSTHLTSTSDFAAKFYLPDNNPFCQ